MSPIDFSRLEKKAQGINEQSDSFTAAITAINDKLNSLNLGIEVVCSRGFDRKDLSDGKELDRYLGYGKLDGKWGILVRSVETVPVSYDRDGSPEDWKTLDVRNTFLLSCSRRIRMKAIDQIPDLIKALEAEAEQFDKAVGRAKEIADSL